MTAPLICKRCGQPIDQHGIYNDVAIIDLWQLTEGEFEGVRTTGFYCPTRVDL